MFFFIIIFEIVRLKRCQRTCIHSLIIFSGNIKGCLTSLNSKIPCFLLSRHSAVRPLDVTSKHETYKISLSTNKQREWDQCCCEERRDEEGKEEWCFVREAFVRLLSSLACCRAAEKLKWRKEEFAYCELLSLSLPPEITLSPTHASA